MVAKPKPKSQSAPKPPTRERLLDAAAALLAEVGMERISTNMICERAGLTPPALYHYFANKYDVAAALGERLMERQNAVLSRWLEQHRGGGINAYAESVGELLRQTAEITEAEPGGVWIERALHSTPRLAHVRVESHRIVTDLMTDAFIPLLPKRSRADIWRRVRMTVEFGYVALELLHSDSGLSRDAILTDTARVLKLATLDLDA